MCRLLFLFRLFMRRGCIAEGLIVCILAKDTMQDVVPVRHHFCRHMHCVPKSHLGNPDLRYKLECSKNKYGGEFSLAS